jgi:hypothetical protein
VPPNSAEAGAKQPERIDEMLNATESVLRKMLGTAVPVSDETLRPPRYASAQSRAGFALGGGST